jgi:hypothetical protein
MTDFAQSILDAIKDRPPDFEDDFSRRNTAWKRTEWCGAHRMSITDGEMRFIDCGASPLAVKYDHYVVAVDAWFLSETKGTDAWVGMDFRIDEGRGWCSYRFNNSGYLSAGCDGKTNAILNSDTQIKAFRPNHLLLIAYHDQFAFYLNEKPVGYLRHTGFPYGTLKLTTLSSTWLGSHAAFGNFKAWNISKIELP